MGILNVGVNIQKWQHLIFMVLNTALLTMVDDGAMPVTNAETEVELLSDLAPEDYAAMFEDAGVSDGDEESDGVSISGVHQVEDK